MILYRADSGSAGSCVPGTDVLLVVAEVADMMGEPWTYRYLATKVPSLRAAAEMATCGQYDEYTCKATWVIRCKADGGIVAIHTARRYDFDVILGVAEMPERLQHFLWVVKCYLAQIVIPELGGA